MSGLHIPAKTGSSIFVFDEIFADIGDEQSISDSLSTFSSHITNIASILKMATENSLVLVDELGSGTDPIEGSSLAISILEYLNQANILTIATTHYHEIKNYALVTNGFENASVDFDFDTMSPTYKLLIGVPGRSNAFIISKKLGIPENILNRAKDFIEKDTINIEELLTKIYKDAKLLEEEKVILEKTLQENELLKNKRQFDANVLEKKEKEILEKAKLQAREILLDAKEDANEMIKKIEKAQNTKQSNLVRKELNKKIEDLSISKEVVNKTQVKKEEIIPGLEVEIPRLNQTGTILSHVTKDDTVMVQIGSMKVSFKISELVLAKQKQEKSKNISHIHHEFKVTKVSPELNVIGKNVEEACFMVDQYLDHCVLNGLPNVQIVHGKGTGTLRRGIHTFLKNHPHVKNFRVGTFGEGEDGITIVELK